MSDQPGTERNNNAILKSVFLTVGMAGMSGAATAGVGSAGGVVAGVVALLVWDQAENHARSSNRRI